MVNSTHRFTSGSSRGKQVRNALSASLAAGVILAFATLAIGSEYRFEVALQAAIVFSLLPFPLLLYFLRADKRRRPDAKASFDHAPFTKKWWETVFVLAILSPFVVGFPLIIVFVSIGWILDS